MALASSSVKASVGRQASEGTEGVTSPGGAWHAHITLSAPCCFDPPGDAFGAAHGALKRAKGRQGRRNVLPLDHGTGGQRDGWLPLSSEIRVRIDASKGPAGQGHAAAVRRPQEGGDGGAELLKATRPGPAQTVMAISGRAEGSGKGPARPQQSRTRVSSSLGVAIASTIFLVQLRATRENI